METLLCHACFVPNTGSRLRSTWRGPSSLCAPSCLCRFEPISFQTPQVGRRPTRPGANSFGHGRCELSGRQVKTNWTVAQLSLNISAGVGAMSVDWVTNPQENGTLMQTSKSEQYCNRLQDLRLNTTVLYGTDPTALLSIGQGTYTCYTADEYQSGALHHALLGLGPDGPLKANTQYHYQVGDPELALSELYSFTTPPEASSFPYRLGLVGDLGQTEDSMDTLDHAAALEPISILNVGDLSYADGYQPRWVPCLQCCLHPFASLGGTSPANI